jgi:hypothetical protein
VEASTYFPVTASEEDFEDPTTLSPSEDYEEHPYSVMPKSTLIDTVLNLLIDDEVDFVIDLRIEEKDRSSSSGFQQESMPKPLPLIAETTSTERPDTTTAARPTTTVWKENGVTIVLPENSVDVTTELTVRGSNNLSRPRVGSSEEVEAAATATESAITTEQAAIEEKIKKHLSNIEKAARKLLKMRSGEDTQSGEPKEKEKTPQKMKIMKRRKKKRRKKDPATSEESTTRTTKAVTSSEATTSVTPDTSTLSPTTNPPPSSTDRYRLAGKVSGRDESEKIRNDLDRGQDHKPSSSLADIQVPSGGGGGNGGGGGGVINARVDELFF